MPVPRDAVLRPRPVVVPAAAHPEAELREDAIDRLVREVAALRTQLTEKDATITHLRSTIEAMQANAGATADRHVPRAGGDGSTPSRPLQSQRRH